MIEKDPPEWDDQTPPEPATRRLREDGRPTFELVDEDTFPMRPTFDTYKESDNPEIVMRTPLVKNWFLLAVGVLQIAAGIVACCQGKWKFGIGTAVIGAVSILWSTM